MKVCMGTMMLGLAVGIAIATVYPVPVRGCTIRRIKRRIRRGIRSAENMF